MVDRLAEPTKIVTDGGEEEPIRTAKPWRHKLRFQDERPLPVSEAGLRGGGVRQGPSTHRLITGLEFFRLLQVVHMYRGVRV